MFFWNLTDYWNNQEFFQGCVYCLILNYHGSLLRCLKQLYYYIKFISACQEVFYSFQNFLNSCSLRATQISYHICSFLSTTFLKPFYKKRRKRDLNPRAGCPTYTLSRGASSASWVFLLDCFRNAYTLYKNNSNLVNNFFKVF